MKEDGCLLLIGNRRYELLIYQYVLSFRAILRKIFMRF